MISLKKAKQKKNKINFHTLLFKIDITFCFYHHYIKKNEPKRVREKK